MHGLGGLCPPRPGNTCHRPSHACPSLPRTAVLLPVHLLSPLHCCPCLPTPACPPASPCLFHIRLPPAPTTSLPVPAICRTLLPPFLTLSHTLLAVIGAEVFTYLTVWCLVVVLPTNLSVSRSVGDPGGSQPGGRQQGGRQQGGY